jgi:Glyoxalase/Bleomycin resistance protein/Dioxygenase superfamily
MTESTLGNNIATQIGIIVRDIEVKARAWSNILDLPMPEIIITNTLDKTRAEYNGKPTTARAKLAFLHMGGLDVELIEPIGEPSTWMDQLDQHSDSLYHIAFQIKGMQEKVAYLSSQGVPLLQRGEYTGGRYASLDGVPQLGTSLELLENDD